MPRRCRALTIFNRRAQAVYREIGKEFLDVPLTGGGSDGNFTVAPGIPTLDGLGADSKAHMPPPSRSISPR
jgi:glutamate carboxypeptidase